MNNLASEAKELEEVRDFQLNWNTHIPVVEAPDVILEDDFAMEEDPFGWIEQTEKAERAWLDLQRKSERIAGDIVNSMEGVVRGNMSIGDAFKDLGIRALRDFAKAARYTHHARLSSRLYTHRCWPDILITRC